MDDHLGELSAVLIHDFKKNFLVFEETYRTEGTTKIGTKCLVKISKVPHVRAGASAEAGANSGSGSSEVKTVWL